MENRGSEDLLTLKNVSYLHARDPSILAFNRPGLVDVKTNLISELGEETVVPEEKKENLRVYLRIKKGNDAENLYEFSDTVLTCNVPPSSQSMRNMREGDSLKKMYIFSKIFHPETSQTEIFNNVVKPKILDFINGQNSTLLTYGASGSGKTFTVIGTDKEPGMVPRSLEYLFRTLPQLSEHPKVKPLPTGDLSMLHESDYRRERMLRKNLLDSSSSMDRSHHVRTYKAMQQRLSNEPVAMLDDTSDVSLSVWVSFAEIYNEQIYDLLQPDPPRGKQRTKLRLGCSNGHPYIKNLTNISVTSGLEAYQILQYGIHNVNYASTCLNSHSSRSHSIFTIKLVQMSYLDGGTFVSTFSFCDLAGCERSKKTMNVGDRLKESNNINTSLLVLGRCISAIRDSQKQNDNKLVPFRESKLTQLFQRALAGHEDIAMVVTISPKSTMFDETQHVLIFSAIAKEIAIESKQVEKPVGKKGRLSQMAQERMGLREESSCKEEMEESAEDLHNAIQFLQDELERVKNEYETNEKLNRDYLIQGYDKLLEEVKLEADRREKEAEDYWKMQYDIKLNRMKAHYEGLLREKDEEVIFLDSSSEEEETVNEKVKELEEKNENLKKKVFELEREVTKLQMENEVKEKQLKKLTEENIELKKTIDEGVNDFVDLEYKKKALQEEICEWKEKYLSLEGLYDLSKMELNEYRKRTCQEPEGELEFEIPQTPFPKNQTVTDIGSLKKLF